MPVHTGRKAPHGGVYGPQQQFPAPAAGTHASKPGARKLSPDAAATRIQTAWRKARQAKQAPAIKELNAAAAQLTKLTQELREVQRSQPGVPLTQKQYLCLSEPVMKVLFALDAVSCGSSAELRARRKELSTRANALLDELQTAHRAQPAAAAAGGGKSGSAAAAAAAAAGHQQQQQQQQQQAKPKKASWFRR